MSLTSTTDVPSYKYTSAPVAAVVALNIRYDAYTVRYIGEPLAAPE
jgi:hypothetical protein